MLKNIFNRKKQESNLPEPDYEQPENAENSIDANEPKPLSEQINDVNVEAGLPLDSSGGKNNMAKVAVLAVALVGVGIAVAGMIAFSGSGDDDEAVAAQQHELERVQKTQAKDFSTEKLDFKQEEIATAPEPKTVPPIDTAETPQPQPTDAAEAAPELQAEPKEPPTDSRLLGDILVGNRSSGIDGQAVSGNPKQGEALNVSFSESSSENSGNPPAQNSFAARLNPTVTPSLKAQRRTDATYLLAKGTNIPCTLDTQIITTHAGITRCLVTKDVYSANGKVLLLERGTKIIGEQNSAMLHGQARVFVLWNEAETPKGVKVSLASGGAGQLGASGHGARVKYHFWQRFGGAVLISLIGDLGDYYSNRSQSNGQNISFENSSESAQEMATEALKNSINIPPTGFINHGTLINVMVARDVDFGGVYEVVKPYEIF